MPGRRTRCVPPNIARHMLTGRPIFCAPGQRAVRRLDVQSPSCRQHRWQLARTLPPTACRHLCRAGWCNKPYLLQNRMHTCRDAPFREHESDQPRPQGGMPASHSHAHAPAAVPRWLESSAAREVAAARSLRTSSIHAAVCRHSASNAARRASTSSRRSAMRFHSPVGNSSSSVRAASTPSSA